MSLSSYSPPRADVPAGSVTLSVRGLNVNDVSLLMAAHARSIIGSYRAFEQLADNSLDSGQALNKLIIETVVQLPHLSADIIRLACDEPEAGEQADAHAPDVRGGGRPGNLPRRARPDRARPGNRDAESDREPPAGLPASERDAYLASKSQGRFYAHYRNLREAFSLLLATGHADAPRYSIGLIWFEARLVREREREKVALDAVAMQAVIVQVLSGGKHLDKFLKELRDGD